MDFATIYKTAFKTPKPTYEFTRMKFVWIINTYVKTNVLNNIGKTQFAVSGQVEYPPASPIPYEAPPDGGPLSGAVIAATPGLVTEIEYDLVAAAARNDGKAFWPKFFRLIGTGISRSTFLICPLIPDPAQPEVPQYSTPFFYSTEVMSANGSFYQTLGQNFKITQFLEDWEKAGENFRDEIMNLKIQEPEVLADKLGKTVKLMANMTGIFWRHYQGEIKPSYMLYPGTLEGWVIGSIKYE